MTAMPTMNFGALVREFSNMTETAETKKTRTVTEPTFEVTLQSYPDIVITKETPKTRKHLILMPTQSMYYIKTETVSGKSEPTTVRLDVDNLSAFCHGSKLRIENFWMDSLPSGKKEANQLIAYLQYPSMSDMLKYKAAPKMQYHSDDYSHHRFENTMYNAKCAYEVCPSIYKDYLNNERFHTFMTNNPQVVKNVFEAYGASGVRTFVDTVINSLVDVSDEWRTTRYYFTDNRDNLFTTYNMDMQTAIDYICYSAVQFGYADNMSLFFREWIDTLDLQKKMYGKIREKYPDSLPTLHSKLAYQARIKAAEIEESMFARQTCKTVEYEWHCDGYVFLAPKKPQDFRDEATQQANCLAGYIRRYANGDDHIIFMRLAETPEKSIVTIEISADASPKLLQAYRARNTKPTAEEMTAIHRWLDHIGGTY